MDWLAVADHLFSLLVAGSLVVVNWRGVWRLMDMYIIPNDLLVSSWICASVGVFIHMVIVMLQEVFTRFVAERMYPWWSIPISRFYTMVVGIGTVALWKGVWGITDYFSGNLWLPAVIMVGFGVVAVVMLRSVKALLAPPVFLTTDHLDDYFTVETVFETKRSSFFGLCLDAFFTVVVLNMLIVFVWRGSWLILDTFLYPSDMFFSFTVSLILGYSIIVICMILQPQVLKLTRDQPGFHLRAFEDMYLLLCFCGIIFFWRGMFGILDWYLLPDPYAVSGWISTLSSLILMFALYCSQTILLRPTPGSDVYLACCYFRSIVKKSKSFEVSAVDNAMVITSKFTDLSSALEIKELNVSDLMNRSGKEVMV